MTEANDSKPNQPIQPDPNNPSPFPSNPAQPAANVNMKAAVHSAIVVVIGIIAGAIKQYLLNGGMIPHDHKQWLDFFESVGGTVVIGVAALLKQSPIQPSTPNPNQPQETPKQ